MSFEQLAPDVYALDLLTPDECDSLIHEANSRDIWRFSDARMKYEGGARGPQAVSRSKLRAADQSVAFFDSLDAVLDTRVKPPALASLSLSLPFHWNLHLVRSGEGDSVRMHRDDSDGRLHLREYSLLVYLNDQILGGYTFFDAASLGVQPRRGRALLFRSTLVHGGTKIHRGVKYVLLGFLGRQAPPSDAYEDEHGSIRNSQKAD